MLERTGPKLNGNRVMKLTRVCSRLLEELA